MDSCCSEAAARAALAPRSDRLSSLSKLFSSGAIPKPRPAKGSRYCEMAWPDRDPRDLRRPSNLVISMSQLPANLMRITFPRPPRKGGIDNLAQLFPSLFWNTSWRTQLLDRVTAAAWCAAAAIQTRPSPAALASSRHYRAPALGPRREEFEANNWSMPVGKGSADRLGDGTPGAEESFVSWSNLNKISKGG